MARLFFASWLIVVVSVLATTAQAETVPEFVPAWQRPLHSRTLTSLEGLAVGYWDRRGITLPEPVEVFEIPNERYAVARGDEPGHRIWLTELAIRQVNNREAGERFDGRANLCADYLHERGHNAGLSHESGWPIMQAIGGRTPHICWWWTKRIARGQETA